MISTEKFEAQHIDYREFSHNLDKEIDMSYCIAFRKNGLYETLVAKAVEGIEDVRVITIEPSVSIGKIQNLVNEAENDEDSNGLKVPVYWKALMDGLTDDTIFSCLMKNEQRDRRTLDSIIANAIQKDLTTNSQKELCVELFAKVEAMTGQPPRVIIVTDNLEDHAYSVKNEADTARQFWTDTIVQAVGTQPTMMSYEEYKNSSDILDWEWVLVDRHVKSRELNCPWGLVFYIPIENLLESLVTLGIAPSGSWQDSAVEAIRNHILSQVNS